MTAQCLISPAILERAVCSVAAEIAQEANTIREFRVTERQAFTELAACILGSRVRFEDALAAATRLRRVDLLRAVRSKAGRRVLLPIVREAVRGGRSKRDREQRHYRFWRSRSEYIVDTALELYARGRGLIPILQEGGSQREARLEIASVSRGIGPKQASLFLRNTGFGSELAILDSHVLRFMKHLRLLQRIPEQLHSMRAYEGVEKILQRYSQSVGWTLDILDQAIWISMRVAQQPLI